MTLITLLPRPPQAHFNSHAHVERDPAPQTCGAPKRISTHTLTWSVTKNGILKRKILQISTHTLTWSATWNILTVEGKLEKYFNSHAHVERDGQ